MYFAMCNEFLLKDHVSSREVSNVVHMYSASITGS